LCARNGFLTRKLQNNGRQQNAIALASETGEPSADKTLRLCPDHGQTFANPVTEELPFISGQYF
jgi:hypothetical protein